MDLQLNSQNKVALFHEFNQWDEEETLMMCSFFAPAVNLKYNCWINLTEEDIKLIAKKQEEKELFSYTNWWYSKDWVEAIYQFVKDNATTRWWNIPNLATVTNDTEVLDWIRRWYSTMVWIKVNKVFYNDLKDWIVEDFEDYTNYKWDIGHFLNLATWTWRFTFKEDKYEDFMLDNYAFSDKRKNLVKSDIEEILSDLDMKTKFVFF